MWKIKNKNKNNTKKINLFQKYVVYNIILKMQMP